jgi:hypothetical protein
MGGVVEPAIVERPAAEDVFYPEAQLGVGFPDQVGVDGVERFGVSGEAGVEQLVAAVDQVGAPLGVPVMGVAQGQPPGGDGVEIAVVVDEGVLVEAVDDVAADALAIGEVCLKAVVAEGRHHGRRGQAPAERAIIGAGILGIEQPGHAGEPAVPAVLVVADRGDEIGQRVDAEAQVAAIGPDRGAIKGSGAELRVLDRRRHRPRIVDLVGVAELALADEGDAGRAEEVDRLGVAGERHEQGPGLPGEHRPDLAEGVAQPEAGRVGEGLVAAGAEEITLDEELELADLGGGPAGEVEPGLPGVRAEIAVLAVGVAAVRRDGAGGEGVADIGADVVDEVRLDVAADRDRGAGARQLERARMIAAGDRVGEVFLAHPLDPLDLLPR